MGKKKKYNDLRGQNDSLTQCLVSRTSLISIIYIYIYTYIVYASNCNFLIKAFVFLSSRQPAASCTIIFIASDSIFECFSFPSRVNVRVVNQFLSVVGGLMTLESVCGESGQQERLTRGVTMNRRGVGNVGNFGFHVVSYRHARLNGEILSFHRLLRRYERVRIQTAS